MAKTGKNKQKAWRTEAETANIVQGSKHNGRMWKSIKARHDIGGKAVGAPDLLAGLFERGGIKMPKAEALREALRKGVESQQVEEAAA